MTKETRGRKPKRKNKRTAYIMVRLTPSEKKFIEDVRNGDYDTTEQTQADFIVKCVREYNYPKGIVDEKKYPDIGFKRDK